MPPLLKRTDTAIRLRNEADAAWSYYGSICRLGAPQADTREAFRLALEAEEKAHTVEHHQQT